MRVKAHMLAARWSRRERDVEFVYPSSPDGHLLHNAFNYAKMTNGKTLIEELKARGYDLTTLRFSIERKCAACKGPREPNHECVSGSVAAATVDPGSAGTEPTSPA